MTQANQHPEAKQYHAIKNRLFFVHLGLNVLFLVLFFLSGFSEQIRSMAFGLSNNYYLGNAIYLMGFFAILLLINLPLDIYEGFFLEHRYQLSNQAFLSWSIDEMKKALLSGLIMLIAIEVVYFFLRAFPNQWWLLATFFWLFFSLILARLVPTVILPLFYKYKDFDNAQIKGRIISLFQKVGLKLKDIYLIDFSSKTKKVNAMVCGLGRNRRVILTDNLLNLFSDGEIESIVAHEMGHYVHKDIIKLTAFNTLLTFGSFYLMNLVLKHTLKFTHISSVDDIAFLPVMALVFLLFSFLMMPLANAFSRFLEEQADRYSLFLTQNAKDFMAAFEKLGEMNLSEFQPSALVEMLFYDHPPLSKRIQMCRKFQNQALHPNL